MGFRPPGFWRPAHFVQRRLDHLGFTPKHKWLASNLGKEIGTIDHETLQPCGTQVTSAGGFELLCTYNWRVRSSRCAQPEIYVPGEAPGFKMRQVPFTKTVKAGKRKTFRDVNAAQSPQSPFEPMFRAVGVMRPTYKFDDVDVVVNRSSLQHLLRLGRYSKFERKKKVLRFCFKRHISMCFIRTNQSSLYKIADGGRCKDAFRLDLAMIKNTLIITPLWQRNEGMENYGNVFERCFTQHKPGLEQSQSYHRVIRYDLGHLTVAVLYEVDAACPGIPPSWEESGWTLGEEFPQNSVVDEDKGGDAEPANERMLEYPTAAEEALFSSIHKGAFQGLSSYKLATKVTQLGNGTLSAHTAELATMKQFGKGKIRKMPQMWLGRTPVCHRNHFSPPSRPVFFLSLPAIQKKSR